MPIACDKQVFLAQAVRAGFNPNTNFEHVLKTFRNRCRPNFTGEFDGYDCALMQKFADAFDIDESIKFTITPYICGWLDGREYTRGKSDSSEAAVPGNARAG